jgi:hypothetical protein
VAVAVCWVCADISDIASTPSFVIVELLLRHPILSTRHANHFI